MSPIPASSAGSGVSKGRTQKQRQLLCARNRALCIDWCFSGNIKEEGTFHQYQGATPLALCRCYCWRCPWEQSMTQTPHTLQVSTTWEESPSPQWAQGPEHPSQQRHAGWLRSEQQMASQSPPLCPKAAAFSPLRSGGEGGWVVQSGWGSQPWCCYLPNFPDPPFPPPEP